MTKATSDRALMALVALEADEPQPPAAEGRAPSSQSLPTLDERVDMFLGAVYGRERNFSDGERAAARSRILDAMAADLIERLDDRNLDANSQTAAAIARPQVQTDARTIRTGRNRRTRLGFGAVLRDALLFPLIGPAPMRLVAAALATLLVVGGTWSASWFYAVRKAETAIASWIEWEAKSGRVYGCGSQTLRGFPFRIEMSCADPNATVVSGQSTLVVNAKELRAVASLLQPDVAIAEITGPFSLAEPGQSTTFVGNWTVAQVTLRGAVDSPKEASVVFDDLQFYRTTQVSMEPLLTGDRLVLDVRLSPASAAGKSAYDVAARVAGGSIPAGGPIASQPFIAELTAVLHDVGSSTPKTLAARLRDWQMGGGRLEVTKALIRQGDSVATAQGEIGLNDSGRVDGTLRVSTAGAYAQLAQSFIRDGQGDAADRQRMAQSPYSPGARFQLRSLHDAQRIERDMRREAAEHEARLRIERERQQAGSAERVGRDANVSQQAPLAAPNFKPGGPFEVPIRFADGAVYFGSVLLGIAPPLF